MYPSPSSLRDGFVTLRDDCCESHLFFFTFPCGNVTAFKGLLTLACNCFKYVSISIDAS